MWNVKNCLTHTVIWWIIPNVLFYETADPVQNDAQSTKKCSLLSIVLEYSTGRNFKSLNQVMSTEGLCRTHLSLQGSPTGTIH